MQKEATSAWTALQLALDERDKAAQAAGAPVEKMGRAPREESAQIGEAIHKAAALTDRSLPTSFELQAAARIVSASVDRFRTDIVEAIAKEEL